MTSLRPLCLPSTDVDLCAELLRALDDADQHAWIDLHDQRVYLLSSLHGADDLEDDHDIDDDDDDRVVALGRLARLPAWQQEEAARARRILADRTGRYLQIPVASQPGAPGRLRAFAATIHDPDLQDEIHDARRGRGAYRRVKDCLARHGKLDLWFDFQAEADRKLVTAWLRGEGFELEVDEG